MHVPTQSERNHTLSPTLLTLRLSPQSNFSYVLEMKWNSQRLYHTLYTYEVSLHCYHMFLNASQGHVNFPALLISVRFLTVLCRFIFGKAQGWQHFGVPYIWRHGCSSVLTLIWSSVWAGWALEGKYGDKRQALLLHNTGFWWLHQEAYPVQNRT